jgi:hypothetical protein
MSSKYNIDALKCDKDGIFQRPVMEAGILPKHPSVCIFSGSVGSGKTNTMIKLLTSDAFYGGSNGRKNYFDYIILCGPTIKSDSLYDLLRKQKVIIEELTDPEPADIQKILDFQKQQIAKMGIEKAPKTLIIYEDIQVHSVGRNSILRSKPFNETFLASRHNNLSVFLCGQSYKSTPRKCRQQAKGLYYFAGSHSELDHVSEDFAPPGLTSKETKQLIEYATKAPHSFLFVNKFQPWSTRYRKNMDEILEIVR